ncbi:hypothetical protein Q6Y15_004407 [Salmonella enterica]|nr:hypothetical protein [Salmonella enterica]ELL0683414.1 hypothetical protein [Salmonella enterica]
MGKKYELVNNDSVIDYVMKYTDRENERRSNDHDNEHAPNKESSYGDMFLYLGSKKFINEAKGLDKYSSDNLIGDRVIDVDSDKIFHELVKKDITNEINSTYNTYERNDVWCKNGTPHDNHPYIKEQLQNGKLKIDHDNEYNTIVKLNDANGDIPLMVVPSYNNDGDYLNHHFATLDTTHSLNKDLGLSDLSQEFNEEITLAGENLGSGKVKGVEFASYGQNLNLGVYYMDKVIESIEEKQSYEKDIKKGLKI